MNLRRMRRAMAWLMSLVFFLAAFVPAAQAIGAPTVQSAATDSTGSTVIVIFDLAMNPPPAAPAGFTVTLNGSTPDDATAIALDPNYMGMAYDLTLTTAVQYGDTVTLAYNGTAGVTSTLEYPLAGFSNQAVSNDVPNPIPTVSTAATDTTGATVIVTFDQAMAANPPAGAAGFTVSVGGSGDTVTAVALDSNSNLAYDLTLTTAVLQGQDVTLAYTPGTVQSAAGGALAGFTDKTVTNDVQPPAPPTVSTAATDTTGATVIVTFDQAMATPPAAPAGFTVSVGGSGDTVTAVALDGNSNLAYDLTLTTAVLQGQAVFLAYTAGSGVESACGGVLAGFSGQTVKNNVSTVLPPNFKGAATDTAGTTVVVTFDKAMATPPAAPAGFTVTVDNSPDTVTAVGLDSNFNYLYDLTLQTAVQPGDTVTLAYIPGNVQSADGGVLAPFTGKTVTNLAQGAPTVLLAATDTTGNNVVVTFDEAMAANPPAPPAGFTVTVNSGPDTVTDVYRDSSSNYIYNLTLQTAVQPGDTVTLDYASGGVQSSAGVDLASFTGKTVTNLAGTGTGLVPTVLLAATGTTGNTVYVTFDQPMADPPAAPGGFTVKVDGLQDTVRAVYMDTNIEYVRYIYDLTLATTVQAGQTVTLTYTPGTVQSAAGMGLAVFTNKPVQNFVLGVPPTVLLAATDNTGNTVFVTFDKPMAAPPAAPAGFTVRVDGSPDTVTGVAREPFLGYLYNLTLTTPVLNGQFVALDYADFAGVQSADGGTLAGFTGLTVNNIVPPGPAPTVTSAVTGSTGGSLIVTFDKAMATPPPAPAGFTVSVDNSGDHVTGVARDTNPDSYDLALATAVQYGQAVTLAYAAGGVQSADGGVLAGFTGQAVTNLVPGQAPNFLRATTDTTGGTVTVTFDKAMATPPDAPAGFTVTVDGGGDSVTGVVRDANPNCYDLTLATAVQHGQAVTLAYAGGGVESSDGVDLAAFSAQGVTNNVPGGGGTSGGGTSGGGGGGSSTLQAVYSNTGWALVPPAYGGTVALGSQASIIIPAGALQGTAEVTVAVQTYASPAAAPSGFMFLGQAYRFTLDGQDHYTFNQPVTLTFTFDPSKLPAAVTPAVYYWDDTTNQWVDLGGSVTGNTITVTVDHCTQYAVMGPADKFPDVVGTWAQGPIDQLVSLGVLTGYPDGTFRPDNKVTRAEFTALLARIAGLTPVASGSTPFTDVAATAWYAPCVAAAYQAHLVRGTSPTTFAPDAAVTRQEVAVIMMRAMAVMHLTGLAASGKPPAFTDQAAESAWAKAAIGQAAAYGLVRGYPDGTFGPLGTLTRAEGAVILARFAGYVQTSSSGAHPQ